MDRCETCGDELHIGDWPFCRGKGSHTPGLQGIQVVDDSIPGGMTVENMGPSPRTFYSRSEWRRAQRELGLRQAVRHTPTQGSDRNPHTQRFI